MSCDMPSGCGGSGSFSMASNRSMGLHAAAPKGSPPVASTHSVTPMLHTSAL